MSEKTDIQTEASEMGQGSLRPDKFGFSAIFFAAVISGGALYYAGKFHLGRIFNDEDTVSNQETIESLTPTTSTLDERSSQPSMKHITPSPE